MKNIAFSQGRQGFTLAEMVIVIAILAILVTISTPAIFEFMRQRDKLNEENLQMEVRKAIQAYLSDKNKMPDSETWSDDLKGYTNLSTEQIARDVWGRPRMYVVYKDPSRNLQGSPVDVYYATILSMGPNGKAEEPESSVEGVAVDGDEFAPYDDPRWWSQLAPAALTPGSANPSVEAFSKLRPGGDDMLIRFTDYPEKLERYNLTVQRMDRIVNALESYAKNGYANNLAACGALPMDPDTGLTGNPLCDNGAPERMIYYPRSVPVADTTDTASYYNTTVYVDNGNDDHARRAQMNGLMRLLGLPDDFCCSALTLGTDGDPKPFYYFSNPRPRNPSGGCAARPGDTTTKLPARVTTNNDDSLAINPTCG